ncbi:disease resistance protein RGA2-like [Argentina anserina]|uniref:disease resistance protein RGA2-like n=1 Tax=Argentina anserina TaxID=57926 RepID=UPI00217683E6|nr:disease resistance protein RGA2-like [Potentilla anserina]
MKLILNAETEVKIFSSNLKAIQAVLEDAEKQHVENASLRNWLNGLNDVSYEMVDVLDKWNTEIMKQKAMRVCFSIASTCFCVAQVNRATHMYRTATEIKELNETLALISAQKKQFKEEATTDLLSKLLSESSEEVKRVSVIPIVGMGDGQNNSCPISFEQ